MKLNYLNKKVTKSNVISEEASPEWVEHFEYMNDNKKKSTTM